MKEGCLIMDWETWKIDSGRLENGLTVWHKKLPTATAFIGLLVDAGSQRDGKNPGIAHFTEHMLFQGTQKMPGEQIKVKAAENGIRINAATSKEYLMVITAAVLPEKTSTAMSIIRDVSVEPLFDQEAFNRERKVVLAEIGDKEDSSLDKAIEIAFANICNKPYKTPVLGYKETIENLKIEDMIAFHKGLYVPNNSTLCYAGPLDFSEVMQECQNIFGKWPRQEIIYDTTEYQGKILNDLTLSRDGFTQTAVVAAFPGVKTDSDDEVLIEIACDIIGGSSMVSRMFRKLRNEMSLCYYCGAKTITFKQENGVILLCGSTSAENAKTFSNGIIEIVNRIRSIAPATEQEFQISKTRTLSLLASELDDLSSYMSIFSYLWTGKNLHRLQDVISKLQAVKLKDIHRIIDKYFGISPTIITVGKCSEEQQQPITFEGECGAPPDRPMAPSSHAARPTSVPRPFATGDTSNVSPIQTEEGNEKSKRPSRDQDDEDEMSRSLPDSEPTCAPKESKICKKCGDSFDCLEGAVVSICPKCKISDIAGTSPEVHPVSIYTKNNDNPSSCLVDIKLGDKTFSLEIREKALCAPPVKPVYKDYGAKAEDFSKPATLPKFNQAKKTSRKENESQSPEYSEEELQRQAEKEAGGAEKNSGKDVYAHREEEPVDSQPRDARGRFDSV